MYVFISLVKFEYLSGHLLRVYITIVYEHTVCTTSAFSMYMLRIVFNVVLF